MTVDGRLVGFCIVNTDYLKKYTFAKTKKDFIIKPYYVIPEMRGKGFAKRLLSCAIDDLRSQKYNSLFAIVHKDNVHSKKALESVDMKHIGFVSYRKTLILKTVHSKQMTPNYLYRIML